MKVLDLVTIIALAATLIVNASFAEESNDLATNPYTVEQLITELPQSARLPVSFANVSESPEGKLDNLVFELTQVEVFTQDAKFIVGDDLGGLKPVDLKPMTLYRGEVEGKPNSYAFLVVNEETESLSGSVVSGDQAWNLGYEVDTMLMAKSPSAFTTPPVLPDFIDDAILPPDDEDERDNTPADKPATAKALSSLAENELNCGALATYTSATIQTNGETCVHSLNIPKGTVANISLSASSSAEQGTRGRLIVRRASTNAVECDVSSADVSADLICNDIRSGDAEVLVSATHETSYSWRYSLDNSPSAAPGYQFTSTVALDIDFALYESFGSLEILQTYLATLFDYNNTIFENETSTKFLIGTIRARVSAEDAPFSDSNKYNRLYEIRDSWRNDEILKGVDRSLVVQLSKVRFGGVAWYDGLCNSYGYSVSGVYGDASDIAGTLKWDNIVVSHEIGHNVSARHSHNQYDAAGSCSPIDICTVSYDSCVDRDIYTEAALPGLSSLTGGSRGEGNGSIMSYCHVYSGGGGISNISPTFGHNFEFGVNPDRIPNKIKNYVGRTSYWNSSCVSPVMTGPDTDSDSVPDSVDNCPNQPNTNQLDTDGDGRGNICDDDDDNDGVADADDAFPLDPSESKDSDQDGYGDNTDQCPNSPESDAGTIDETGCGFSDGDEDGDGVRNGDDAFPYNSEEWEDSDSDGWGDNIEAEFGSDKTNPNDYPVIKAVPMFLAADSDRDGLKDALDNCPRSKNADQLDTDSDGLGNVCDDDDDNDGILDSDDAFPLDPSESADADNDGVGDNSDQCPESAESDRGTIDSTGCGYSSGDEDGDGVPNGSDVFPLDPNETVDSDGDGWGDNIELEAGSNASDAADLPWLPSSALDFVTSSTQSNAEDDFCGGALSLPGDSDLDRISIRDSESIHLGNEFTLEARIFIRALNARSSILFDKYRPTDNEREFRMSVTPEGALKTWFSYNGTTSSGSAVLSPDGAISTNRWIHVAVSFDGLMLRLFIDGSLVASTESSGNPTQRGTWPIVIGSNGFSTHFWDESSNALFDEFRLSATSRYSEDFLAPTVEFGSDSDTLLLFHFTNGLLNDGVAGGDGIFSGGADVVACSL
ncbi:thrombospondin type 3 repeat-containing protein [Luminiphilus sp.]|nr:thrombospondin type 3 repeat-containing protein [Luminiphilus sp.]